MSSPPQFADPIDQHLAEQLLITTGKLLAAGRRVATAESCTGGLLAKLLTDQAGSSQWFECGWITYANTAKLRELGVLAPTLEQHGAVSEATVREMALGALQRSGADVAIAISGVAGPDGGTARNPVGRVWFARAVRGAPVPVVAREQNFNGNRDTIRRQAALLALRWLADA
jgi:nicotinamide-nucleotide amidase